MGLAYCSLFSGSSGNSAVIASEQTKILIDAGMPGKTLTSQMQGVGIDPSTICAIVITHEHSDHIKAAGIMSRKYDLPIYANEKTWCAMEKKVGNVSTKNIRIFATGHDFSLGDINVYPFLIPHDAAEPVGYCFHYKNLKIAQLTDLGHVPKHLLNIVENSDLLLLESNHDVQMLQNGEYPYYLKQRILSNRGHLSNETCANACQELLGKNCKRFIIGHLSGENNNEKLAFETVLKKIVSGGAIEKKDFELYIAHRSQSSDVFYLE